MDPILPEDDFIGANPFPFKSAHHATSSPFERAHVDHDFILVTMDQALPSPAEALAGEDYSLRVESDDSPWEAVTIRWFDGVSARLHMHSGNGARRENGMLLDRFEMKRIEPDEERYLREGALEFGILPIVEDESERTLEFVQRMARIIDEFQRQLGGVVIDLKQFALYGRAWSEPPEAEYGEFLRFVHVHQVLARKGIWAHTHGMAHFGKPDVEVIEAPVDREQEYAVWLLESCWHQATVGELMPMDSLEDPFGRACTLMHAQKVANQQVSEHYRNDCLRVVLDE